MRVFVFEKDKALATKLRSALIMKGHNVVAFTDHTACDCYLKSESCCTQKIPCADVLISDQAMAKMSGEEFFVFQRERGCWVLDKNKALITDPLNCSDSEYHCIGKPFNIPEILAWIDDCEKRASATGKLAPKSSGKHFSLRKSDPSTNGKRLKAEMRVFCQRTNRLLLSGFSVDLSSGGVYIKTDHLFEVDEEIKLTFTLPVTRKTIVCPARVAWVNSEDNPQKPDLPTGIGVQFEDMSAEDVKSVYRFIRDNEIIPSGQNGLAEDHLLESSYVMSKCTNCNNLNVVPKDFFWGFSGSQDNVVKVECRSCLRTYEVEHEGASLKD